MYNKNMYNTSRKALCMAGCASKCISNPPRQIQPDVPPFNHPFPPPHVNYNVLNPFPSSITPMLEPGICAPRMSRQMSLNAPLNRVCGCPKRQPSWGTGPNSLLNQQTISDRPKSNAMSPPIFPVRMSNTMYIQGRLSVSASRLPLC